MVESMCHSLAAWRSSMTLLDGSHMSGSLFQGPFSGVPDTSVKHKQALALIALGLMTHRPPSTSSSLHHPFVLIHLCEATKLMLPVPEPIRSRSCILATRW